MIAFSFSTKNMVLTMSCNKPAPSSICYTHFSSIIPRLTDIHLLCVSYPPPPPPRRDGHPSLRHHLSEHRETHQLPCTSSMRHTSLIHACDTEADAPSAEAEIDSTPSLVSPRRWLGNGSEISARPCELKRERVAVKKVVGTHAAWRRAEGKRLADRTSQTTQRTTT